PLALPAPVFTRLPADADMLAGLCESLRFGPMTRRRLLTAAGVAPPFPVTTDFRP
ncbi:exodeoxyribonuclease IX, partial [Xanthomonas sp. Kuri4-2]